MLWVDPFPAGLSEVTRAIFLVADRALLPCGPSALDLRAVNEAIRVVQQAQRIRQGVPTVVVVPNELQRHYRLSKELVEAVATLEVDACDGLPLRQASADAAGQGTLVWHIGSRGRSATHEIRRLFDELFG